MNIGYTEALPKVSERFLPPSLSIRHSIYQETVLIRMLLGTINLDIDDGYINHSIIQRVNFSTSAALNNGKLTLQILKDFLNPYTISDLDKYLQFTKNVNAGYFKAINTEVALYFTCMSQRNGLSAFLYCYRILEYISYSFPLIHASTSKSFMGTFQSLQSYFVKDAGELSFLQKFIIKLFDDENLLNTPVDINITAPTVELRDAIYKSYKRILSKYISFDDQLYQISIKPADIVDVITTLRNRYFHFAVGGIKNLKNDDLINPDVFFLQINQLCMTWISMIYFETLKSLIGKWAT